MPILTPAVIRMPTPIPSQSPSQPPLHPPAMPFALPYTYTPPVPIFAPPSIPANVSQLPMPAAYSRSPANIGTQPQLQTHPHSHMQPYPHEHPRTHEHDMTLNPTHPRAVPNATTIANQPARQIARHSQPQSHSTAAHPHPQLLHTAIQDMSPGDMIIPMQRTHHGLNDQHDDHVVGHTHAPVGHGPASSSTLAGIDPVPPSFGDLRNLMGEFGLRLDLPKSSRVRPPTLRPRTSRHERPSPFRTPHL